MNIEKLILEKISSRGEIKASEIVKETGFSRVYINRFFRKLQDEGLILLLGKANQARYIMATETSIAKAKSTITKYHRILSNRDLEEHKILSEIKSTTGIFSGLKENVSKIISYAFLEMANNAIEHSLSEKIQILIQKKQGILRFDIVDTGIGIFNKIKKMKNLASEVEAIQDLLKGKLTTAESKHSGEGIFFSSKMADIFIIRGSAKKIVFNNLLDDQYVKTIQKIVGTRVSFSLGLDSTKDLSSIFKKYTDDSFTFNKTEIRVTLYKIGTGFLSRSQARRILHSLEKFTHILLDFEGIDIIGQAFADEIFRVWKNNNPETKISHEKANEDVQFMIDHVLKQT